MPKFNKIVYNALFNKTKSALTFHLAHPVINDTQQTGCLVLAANYVIR